MTIVSPDTFTTFTPLLPCESAASKAYTVPDINGAFSAAAVGTVSVRSLIESLRKVIARLHGQLIHGRAVDLVMSERLLEVETVSVDGEMRNIYIPCGRYYSFERFHKLNSFFRYDKLVIAVGSVSSTHGVPGLEHCFQLKTVADAQAIRRRVLGEYFCTTNSSRSSVCIVDNFEMASLPSTSEEERKRLLSFVVCGGGPTGVETAAVRPHPFPTLAVFAHLITRRSLIFAKKTSLTTWAPIFSVRPIREQCGDKFLSFRRYVENRFPFMSFSPGNTF